MATKVAATALVLALAGCGRLGFAGIADAGIDGSLDAFVPDAGMDARLPDVGLDTGLPDARLPDGGCAVGTADCNALAMDGCETLTAVDPLNCGGCGAVCVLAHATAACVGAVCQVGACQDVTWDDCNMSDRDGCEADLTLDPAHCGACGVACAAGEQCFSGVCGPACGAGPARLPFPTAGCLNIAPGQVYSASGTWTGYSVGGPADGNPCTAWNAGGGPPGWWMVDFGARRRMDGVTLVPIMAPSTGFVTHIVETSDDAVAFTPVHTISQSMTHAMTYSFVFSAPATARYLRIRTTASISWVAWSDIGIFRCP